MATPALDNVAAARTAHINEVSLLELVDEIGKASRAIGTLAKRWIELEHGALQKAELRLNGAALQHL